MSEHVSDAGEQGMSAQEKEVISLRNRVRELEGVLLSKHGGEPLALLVELNEARGQLRQGIIDVSTERDLAVSRLRKVEAERDIARAELADEKGVREVGLQRLLEESDRAERAEKERDEQLAYGNGQKALAGMAVARAERAERQRDSFELDLRDEQKRRVDAVAEGRRMCIELLRERDAALARVDELKAKLARVCDAHDVDGKALMHARARLQEVEKECDGLLTRLREVEAERDAAEKERDRHIGERDAALSRVAVLREALEWARDVDHVNAGASERQAARDMWTSALADPDTAAKERLTKEYDEGWHHAYRETCAVVIVLLGEGLLDGAVADLVTIKSSIAEHDERVRAEERAKMARALEVPTSGIGLMRDEYGERVRTEATKEQLEFTRAKLSGLMNVELGGTGAMVEAFRTRVRTEAWTLVEEWLSGEKAPPECARWDAALMRRFDRVQSAERKQWTEAILAAVGVVQSSATPRQAVEAACAEARRTALEECRPAIRDVIRCLEPIVQTGMLSQGGESRGNRLDVEDCLSKLHALAKKDGGT